VDLKLDVYKLNEDPIVIHGYYRLGEPPLPSCVYLERDAFSIEYKAPARFYAAPGTLYNTNTIEAFKNLPKANLFKTATGKIWHDITSGEALRDPWLLNRFLLLTFADLKKYRFYYMFGYPALHFGDENVTASPSAPLLDFLSVTELSALYEALASPTNIFRMKMGGYFLLKKDEQAGVRIGKLTDWGTFWEKDETPTVGFADPSALPSPGWPLRNLLVLLAVQFKVKEVNIVCYRGRTEGIWFKAHIPDAPAECPQSSGWERNQKGDLAPRFVSLESTLDPKSLANTSVDLNLKLMRWRILPALNLEAIAQSKCLLLGAGTLGCNVARCLMSWGVRNITFVDNGTVSYSNPVRQSLYEFLDCADGGKPKAAAAAAKLKAIFPNVESQGIQFSIPMPGHAVTESELPHVKDAVQQLQELVKAHDVIFLLTDSRESRCSQHCWE
jgi:ubiquitin-like modifier-activating enzyme ATG7